MPPGRWPGPIPPLRQDHYAGAEYDESHFGQPYPPYDQAQEFQADQEDLLIFMPLIALGCGVLFFVFAEPICIGFFGR